MPAVNLKQTTVWVLLGLNLFAAHGVAQSLPSLAKMKRATTLMSRFMKESQDQEYAKAVETLDEFLPLADELFGQTNPDMVVRMEINRGTLLRDLGRFDEAVQQLEVGIRHARQRLGTRHGMTGVGLNALGAVYVLKGDHEKAQPLLDQSIQVLEAAQGDWANDRVDALTNYAELLAEQGFLTAALKQNKQSFELSKQTSGLESMRTAKTLNNLSMRYRSIGNMPKAEETVRESLRIERKLYGVEHEQVARTLQNLALVLTEREKYEEAIASFQAAVPMLQSKLGVDHPIALTSQGNFGKLYMDLGQLPESRPLLEDTLRRQTAALGPEHPSTATTRFNLGMLHVYSREYDQAKSLIEEAIAVLEGIGQFSKTAEMRAVASMTDAMTGNLTAAVDGFQQSLQTANRAAWQELPDLPGNEQRKFMIRSYDATLYLALSLGFRHPNDQQVVDATAEWIANGKGIAAEALAAARAKDIPNELPWVTLDALRESIPTDGIWIDISKVDVKNYEAQSRKETFLEPSYVAWVVPKVGAVQRVELGDAAAIDALVNQVLTTVGQAAGQDGDLVRVGEVEATDNARKQLSAVAERVWAPIQAKLPKNTKRILLSPDGTLWLLPWAALPVSPEVDADAVNDAAEAQKAARPEGSQAQEATPAATGEYLIQRYAIATFGSGRQLATEPTTPPAATSQSAVFSDPDFDQGPNAKKSALRAVLRRDPAPVPNGQRSFHAFDPTKSRAAPLPGTAMEAKSIQPSMTTWLNGREPVQYQGKFALEGVAKQCVSPRGLVFATHGFFIDDEAQTFDPLLRCGLLLAGCNDAASATREDDGVLTGVEISRMKLRGTELVVLSACETGVGRIETGNGVAGLRRAFHLAGAQSVASTLWQIPDFDTAKLMGDFFAAIAKGQTKDEALRRAQIQRIESRTERNGAAHPFFWAGFSISGR